MLVILNIATICVCVFCVDIGIHFSWYVPRSGMTFSTVASSS